MAKKTNKKTVKKSTAKKKSVKKPVSKPKKIKKVKRSPAKAMPMVAERLNANAA